MKIAQEILKKSNFQETINELCSQVPIQNNTKVADNCKINNLRQHFCCAELTGKPEEIYNSASVDFFSRYGLSNIIKNYYLLSELNQLGLLNTAKKILDLGSGPGTFPLAYLMWHVDHPKLCKKNHKIVMVDGAREFFTLFERLWGTIEAKEKKHFDVVTIPFASDGKFPDESKQSDLIIFSNSLLEMLRDARVQWKTLIKNLIESLSVIVIIDYPYDKTSRLLQKFTAELSPYYKALSFYEWPQWNDFFRSVDLKKIDNSLDMASGITPKENANVRFLI
jgi:ribosomal protein RSM22 (predicted rRNA methylase)